STGGPPIGRLGPELYREADGGGAAGHVSVAVFIDGDPIAAIVTPAAEVAGVDERGAIRLHLRHERVAPVQASRPVVDQAGTPLHREAALRGGGAARDVNVAVLVQRDAVG